RVREPEPASVCRRADSPERRHRVRKDPAHRRRRCVRRGGQRSEQVGRRHREAGRGADHRPGARAPRRNVRRRLRRYRRHRARERQEFPLGLRIARFGGRMKRAASEAAAPISLPFAAIGLAGGGLVADWFGSSWTETTRWSLTLVTPLTAFILGVLI